MTHKVIKSSYAPQSRRILIRSFLLSLIYLFIVFSSFAQKNIGIVITSPAPGANIDSGQTVYTVVQIYNYSTDTLRSTDSIVVELRVNGSLKAAGSSTLTDVVPGDYYELSFPITWTVTTDINNADYCVRTYMAHNTDPDTTNNNNCIKVNFKALVHSTGIVETGKNTSVSVYPNPASSMLIIQSQQEMNDLLCIYTYEGRLITSQPVAGTERTISLAGFPNGTFMYTLSNSSGVKYKTGILVIHH